jgi:hypothetical protein
MNKEQDLETINYELQFQNNLFLKRIAELEAQLAERDALLDKKDEALRCIDEDLVNPVNYILVKEALTLKLKESE